MITKIACYCRVSTKKEEQALSLDNQKRFFEEFIQRQGIADDNYELYVDEGISAKSMKKRDSFNRMVADAKKGLINRILVKDISRFARNVYDFLGVIRELKAHKVIVQFVTYNMDTTDSEFTLIILAALAQEESASLSRRVKFGKKEGAKQGRVPSQVYGYEKIKGDKYGLSIIPSEAAIVQRVFKLFTEKQMSTYQIAIMFNQERVPTKRGEPYKWSQTVVSGIIKNRLYIGEVCNGKSEITDFISGDRIKYAESEWLVTDRPDLRIVSDEIFQKANAIRTSRGNSFNQFEDDGISKRKRPSIKYPLSNLLVCVNDNYSFRRRHRTYDSGYEYKYWTCSKRDLGAGVCNNKVKIDEGQFHNTISTFLTSLFTNQAEICRLFRDKVNTELMRRYAQEIDLKALKDEYNTLALEREKLMELYLDKDSPISKEYLTQKLSPVERRLNEIDTSLSVYNNRDTVAMDIEKCLARMTERISTHQNDWLDNAFLKSIFDKFLVYSDGRIEAILKLATDTDVSLTIPFCEIVDESKIGVPKCTNNI